MIIADKKFENYTYVMAIINLTPDSFYSPSRTLSDDVLFRAERAIKDGAAILDLGAQSTRPGYKEVPPEEELARLEKPLEAVLKNFDIPVSVDTYFPKVAKAAFDMGAHLLNDIWGLTAEGMAETVAKANGSVCIMHNAKNKLEGDIFPQIESFLTSSVQKALNAGVDKDKICLDGGIGFAKDREQNLYLLDNYERLSSLGYPLLLGTSRKSLFGGVAEDRLEATVNSTRMAARKKILFVRVHDVKENYQAIKEEYERN
ncbi:MAG: dihydropteroate synthase [Candidatus Coproplasma sp.]